MIRDFANRNRDDWASTETLAQIASEHFARSPIGQKFGAKDLSWFFAQWVFQTALPTYHLDYSIQQSETGDFVLKGTLNQTNAPENWMAFIPLVFDFPNKRQGRTVIGALGPKTPVEIRLPEKPEKATLDPERWILSEKTSQTRR